MASQQLNIRISEEEHQHLENLALQTEGILTKQAVARLLIKHAIATGWKPLTASDTLVERRGDTPARVGPLSETSKAVSSSSKKELLINKSVSTSIPEKLEPYGELIKEFWKIKKGSKGQTAWTRLMGQLTKLLDRYGDTVTRDQLELAINGKWSGIEVSRYEQFLPKGTAPKREKPKELTQEERDARHMEHLKKLGLV